MSKIVLTGETEFIDDKVRTWFFQMEKIQERRWKQTKDNFDTLRVDIRELKKRLKELENETK